MDDLYGAVKTKKLRFKGDKPIVKEKYSKKRRKTFEEAPPEPDTVAHGGWRLIKSVNGIQSSFSVTLELRPNQYLRSIDNGKTVPGRIHELGEEPDQEEIFTCVRIDHKIALKTGYGKYLGVDLKGQNIVGIADIYTENEMWCPVFENHKMALFGNNGMFVTWSGIEGDPINCTSPDVSENEVITMRTNASEFSDFEDEKFYGTTLRGTEFKFVQQYQSFLYRKIKLSQEDQEALALADEKGKLHEEMLNRRCKVKSDKFCS